MFNYSGVSLLMFSALSHLNSTVSPTFIQDYVIINPTQRNAAMLNIE